MIAPRSLPGASARYALKRCPSVAVSSIVLPISVTQYRAQLEHAANARHEVVGHRVEVEPWRPTPVAPRGRVVDRFGPAVEDALPHRIGCIRELRVGNRALHAL